MKPVDLEIKIAGDGNARQGSAAWAGVPASIFMIAALVLWRGQRR